MIRELTGNNKIIHKMNILVTGAAGFIGSHVCEYFIERGSSVVGIDNFDNYYPRDYKELNLIRLRTNNRFSLFEADIRDEKSLSEIFGRNSFDLVIHLAAKAGVRPSIEAIGEYYDVNVTGTINLLEVMRQNEVKNMLFGSSSSVYGNNKKVPFSEDDFVDNPISPYASTKKSGELLCHVYCHLYGFNITCLRFFTVFGPRQRPDLAIHKFTRLIDESKPIPFYGDGTTSRDYTYITDILNGIECASKHLNGYNVYNLGESRTVDLNTLVRTIESVTGKNSIKDKMSLQPGDVKTTFADISKAKKEIGYDPNTDLCSGIKSFYEWYSENRNSLNG